MEETNHWAIVKTATELLMALRWQIEMRQQRTYIGTLALISGQ